MKINKIMVLASVFGLVYATGSNVFVNANAALTAPSSYDLNYRQFNGKFRLGGSSGGTDILSYQRTADGAYYNYSNTWDNTDYSLIPLGLEITMTFNRSNVGNWNAVGTPPNELYQPWDSYIGADATVGSINNKVYLKFENQTNKDYKLWLDFSSGNRYNTNWDYTVNTVSYDDNNVYVAIADALFLASYAVPAFSTVIFSQTQIQTNARYFDAWYLQDLGVSDAYDQGYGVGYDDGYDDALTDGGIFGIFTAVFTAMGAFLSIAIFGDITLGTVLLFPLMFGVLFFILRVIRGQ